jgi:hypothetical protein
MKRWEARVNHVGWGVTAVSGVLYGVLKYFVSASDSDSRLSVPWQPSVLAAHVLAAPVAVFALGLIFRKHVLVRLLAGQREGRPTGTLLTWCAFPLALSGYLLLVITGGWARRWTGWIHAAVGLLFAAGYALHPRGSGPPIDPPEPAPEP